MAAVLERSSLPVKNWGEDERGESAQSLKVEFVLLAFLMGLPAIVAILVLLGSVSASAHPGGLAADGCHNDRKSGGRHCHRSSKASEREKPKRSGSAYYANCAEARAAGAAPIFRGQPGYGAHLDRDGDGKACE